MQGVIERVRKEGLAGLHLGRLVGASSAATSATRSIKSSKTHPRIRIGCIGRWNEDALDVGTKTI